MRAPRSLPLLAGLVLAACGGDGDEDHLRNPPKPKAPLSSELAAWNRASASQRCPDFVPRMLTFTRAPGARPGGPPVADDCRVLQPVWDHLRGVRLRQAREFGTAGIASGPGPRRGRFSTYTAIFVLDWDGRFRTLGGKAAEPQIGTRPRPGTDFQATAEGFVKAVRDRDCAALQRFSMPGNAIIPDPARAREACDRVLRGRNLAPQLSAAPGARPHKLGETRDLAFYGVATRRNYYTLLLQAKPTSGVAPNIQRALRGKPNALVSDYFPNYRPLG